MRTKLPGKKFFCAFWILFLVAELSAHSQEFGGNPPSIKWQQVNIPAAKVIFPQGLDSAAFEVAGIIARMNNSIQPTIGSRQKQVSIVLQNQTTIANAYVGLAPFRSEFYLTPEQNSFDIGSLPWTAQLSIHEFSFLQILLITVFAVPRATVFLHNLPGKNTGMNPAYGSHQLNISRH